MELLLRPWKLYAHSSGRSRRAEFWLFYLVKYGPVFLLGALNGALTTEGSGEDPYFSGIMLLAGIWLLATLVPSIVLIARRLHDFGAGGTWVLTTFIPYVGFLALIVIGLIPGSRGDNEKGEDPRNLDPQAMAEIFE